MNRSDVLLGTDFDNTVVSYERVFPESAKAMGVVAPEGVTGKAGLREFLRSLPDGEILWQKVQADVYGARMGEAQMIPGFRETVAECRDRSVTIKVVSHKTQFATQDANTDLHEAAMCWMETEGFFDKDGLGFERNDVHFEPTRKDKVQRVGRLGCTHFVDDLPEVFADPDFPIGVDRLLLTSESMPEATVKTVAGWPEVIQHLFGCGS